MKDAVESVVELVQDENSVCSCKYKAITKK